MDNNFFFSMVKIEQGVIFEIQNSSIAFASQSGVIFDYLTANVSWVVTSMPSWIGVNPESGTNSYNLRITADENSGNLRTGTITLTSSNGLTLNISITQSGA